MIRTGRGDDRIRLDVAQLIRPGVGQLLIDDRIGTTQVSSRVEMQIHLYDTVATVDRMEIIDYNLVLIVVLAVVTDGSTIRARVHVLVDGVFRSRPNGELQSEDRINLIGSSGCINSVYIRTATPYILAAPNNRVALAG